VPILPQAAHSRAVAATSAIACASGAITCPRFLIRCSTARRAERGPSPGSRAIRSISASMSRVASGTSERQLHVGRQAEALVKPLHLVLRAVGRLLLGVLDGGDDQILDHLFLRRVEDRGV